MRGAIEEIDQNCPIKVTDPRTVAMAKHWRERQEAQHELREAIALWAGVQRDMGRPDSEIYRRFYHSFGTDVMSAQTLGRKDADNMKEKINAYLY